MGDQISRPMQIALIVAVLFALAWFVALRPDSSTSSPSPSASSAAASSPPSGSQAPGAGGLGNAVDDTPGNAASGPGRAVEAAKGAAAATEAAQAARGGATAPEPGGTSDPGGATASEDTRTAAGARPGGPDAAALAADARAPGAPGRAARALARGRVLVVLFHNPRAADDRAVRASLRSVAVPKGVVKVIAPLGRVSSFRAVTRRVSVSSSPTLVVFDRRGQPSTLVGFVEAAEIRQRIADARTP